MKSFLVFFCFAAFVLAQDSVPVPASVAKKTYGSLGETIRYYHPSVAFPKMMIDMVTGAVTVVVSNEVANYINPDSTVIGGGGIGIMRRNITWPITAIGLDSNRVRALCVDMKIRARRFCTLDTLYVLH